MTDEVFFSIWGFFGGGDVLRFYENRGSDFPLFTNTTTRTKHGTSKPDANTHTSMEKKRPYSMAKIALGEGPYKALSLSLSPLSLSA